MAPQRTLTRTPRRRRSDCSDHRGAKTRLDQTTAFESSRPSHLQPQDAAATAGQGTRSPERDRSRPERVDSPYDLRRQPRGDLRRLAGELQRELIASVSMTAQRRGTDGGGTELSVALHYVFDTPHDRLIWDANHQGYPYQVLAGRRARERRVGNGGDRAGTALRSVCAYDPFGALLSAAPISAALDVATARDLAGDDHWIIAVVGSQALCGALGFEGLSAVGAHGRKLIIVLNDSEPSVSRRSGAMADHVSHLRLRLPDPATREAALQSGTLPSFAGETTLYDHLGVRYAGPFDGRDADEIATVFETARETTARPLLIHLVAVKSPDPGPRALSCASAGV